MATAPIPPNLAERDERLRAEIRAAMSRPKPKVTIEELARRVGMHPEAVRRRVTGDVALTFPQALAFAEALGIEDEELLRAARSAA